MKNIKVTLTVLKIIYFKYIRLFFFVKIRREGYKVNIDCFLSIRHLKKTRQEGKITHPATRQPMFSIPVLLNINVCVLLKIALSFKPKFKLLWPSEKWRHWNLNSLVRIHIKFKRTVKIQTWFLADTQQILFSILHSRGNEMNWYILLSIYDFHVQGIMSLFWLIFTKGFWKSKINHIPITFIRPVKPKILV